MNNLLKKMKNCKSNKERIIYVLSILFSVFLFVFVLIGLIGGWVFLLRDSKSSSTAFAETSGGTYNTSWLSYYDFDTGDGYFPTMFGIPLSPSLSPDNAVMPFELSFTLNTYNNTYEGVYKLPLDNIALGWQDNVINYGSDLCSSVAFLADWYPNNMSECLILLKNLDVVYNFDHTGALGSWVYSTYPYIGGLYLSPDYYQVGYAPLSTFINSSLGSLVYTDDLYNETFSNCFYYRFVWTKNQFGNGFVNYGVNYPDRFFEFIVLYTCESYDNDNIRTFVPNDFAETDWHAAYNDGYSIGYRIGTGDVNSALFDDGYSSGFDDGYISGLDVSFGDISPFEAIASGVNSFFNIEVLPGFRVYMLFSIAFGMLLMGVFFKIFFHG